MGLLIIGCSLVALGFTLLLVPQIADRYLRWAAGRSSDTLRAKGPDFDGWYNDRAQRLIRWLLPLVLLAMGATCVVLALAL